MKPTQPTSPRRRRSPARPPAESFQPTAGGLPAASYQPNAAGLTAKPSQPAASREDLEEEIALLRAMIRKVVRAAGEDPDLEDLVRQLDVLSIAMVRLAGLLKTQRALGENVSAKAALSQALSETIEEIRCKKPQYARS